MIEIWQDNKGGTISLQKKVQKHPGGLKTIFYGECSEGFDFQRDSHAHAVHQIHKWGYRKVGVE